jgi:hypothetical protein
MPAIDDDLSQLERDIRALKIEYEQYFGGGRSRPPTDTEWRVELMVKRYAERGADMNYAQRFRFNNLTSTYAKYREIWRKRIRQREEGTVQRHFGAAARAIEAERARAATQAERPRPAAAKPFRISCTDPDAEAEKVARLYRALADARRAAGDEAGTMTEEGFREFVRTKTAQLRKEKGAGAVEYSVSVEGGQVKLKARVKK